MKKYEKIIALDFELFNSKYYWSVCWAGVAFADADFNCGESFDIIFNPSIKNKFIGSDMTLPFSYKDIKNLGTFETGGREVLKLLTRDTLVIGHAFENDIKMLVDACKKFNLHLPDFDYIDTNIIYNAAKGVGGEHSLKNLAAEFGVEFTPHNPAEDARAALLCVRAILCGRDIYEFMSEHKIETGGIIEGVFKKCYYAGMAAGQKRRIQNFNRIYDSVKEFGQGKGKSYYIDNAIAAETDTSKLCQKLLNAGARLAASAFSADFVITNNLSVRPDPKNLTLKSMLLRYGVDFEGYDFTPAKIRGADGRAVTLSEYYDTAYKKYEQRGFLNRKIFSFSKSCERRADYEDTVIKIYTLGGRVCVKVGEADYFVVSQKEELKNNLSDGRVRAYNFSHKAEVLEFNEMLKLLEKGK